MAKLLCRVGIHRWYTAQIQGSHVGGMATVHQRCGRCPAKRTGSCW